MVMLSSKDDIVRFLASEFPTNRCVVDSVGEGVATVSYAVTAQDLRPGGTVSGPVLMAVADIALYIAVLGAIGIVPLAVTTSLNFNFLRKPAAHSDIIAHCKLLKVGRALAVGEVSLYSAGSDALVAHAVGTYSIPPRER
jgi:uncharacterized protein (TIGR00369 family)